jgi:hypothetical protein
MECEFMAGDFAMTKDSGSIIERYRGLTCRVVDAADFDGYMRIVFDEDPNGEPGRTYTASTEALIRLCGDESNCEAISEFLDEM